MEQKVRPRRKVRVFVFIALAIVWGLSLEVNASETLKLGVLVPLTGPVAESGTRMLKAFELAATEINQAGGVLGRKLELLVWDTEAKVEKGATGAKKLIMQDKVWGLIGTFRTGVTLAVQDIAAENKMVFMVTDAAGTEITKRVGKDYNKYKYTFRSAASVDHFSLYATPFLTDIVKPKNYYFVGENNLWSRELGELFKKYVEGKGIKCIGSVECDPAATEFTSELVKIKEANPGAIYTTLVSASGVPFIKQYRDMRLNIPIMYGGGHFMYKNVVEGMVEQVNHVAVVAFCWDVPLTPKTMGFYEKYTKYFTRPGGYEDVRSYDGLYILTDGIKRAASFDVEKVIKALEKTKYVGVAGPGPYVFDEEHQAKAGPGFLQGVIFQWINGKAQVLYPASVATSKYVFPPAK